MGTVTLSQPIASGLIPTDAKIINAKIGSKTYTLEIARTMQEKAKGLSGRWQMAANHGMIFVFKHKSRPSFTMHGMRFPLDFVWLNYDKVVELTENVARPAKETIIDSSMGITSDHNFDLAIELNAGEIKNSQVKVGDQIIFN